MINFTAIENALAAWVTAQSGGPLPIWDKQAQPQPALPYITLKRAPPVALILLDPVTISYNGSAPLGQEITTTITAQKEMTVTLECFANTITGAGTAAEYLSELITSLRFPSVLAALYAVGLSIRRKENVLDLSALVATAFQTRASVEIVLGLVDVATDVPTGYIDTAQVTPTISGVEYPEYTITFD